MHNLFCQSVDCDNLAMWGDESVGFWCRWCWERMTTLIAQKHASGLPLTPAQAAVHAAALREYMSRHEEG